MSVTAAALLLSCAVIVPMAPGSGGFPLPCRWDTICLRDYNREHRLTLTCGNRVFNLDKNGEFLGHNVTFDGVSGCFTWHSGLLVDCTVRETDHDGRKMEVHFTYNCTQALMPSSQMVTTSSTAEETKRRHTSFTAAVIVVPALVLVGFLVCRLTGFRLYGRRNPPASSLPGNFKEQTGS